MPIRDGGPALEMLGERVVEIVRGFGTFAARPMNTSDVAERKLATMVEAARTLRDGGAAA